METTKKAKSPAERAAERIEAKINHGLLTYPPAARPGIIAAIIREEYAPLVWAVERALTLRGPDKFPKWTKAETERSWADWETKARAALAAEGGKP